MRQMAQFLLFGRFLGYLQEKYHFMAQKLHIFKKLGKNGQKWPFCWPSWNGGCGLNFFLFWTNIAHLERPKAIFNNTEKNYLGRTTLLEIHVWIWDFSKLAKNGQFWVVTFRALFSPIGGVIAHLARQPTCNNTRGFNTNSWKIYFRAMPPRLPSVSSSGKWVDLISAASWVNCGRQTCSPFTC